MATIESEQDFLEELGNLLVDYPNIAAEFTVPGSDPDAIAAREPRAARWGRVPGDGWVCLSWER